jgi:hypothetical protein
MVPAPVPDMASVSVVLFRVNVACAERAAVIATTHVFPVEPEHDPPQPTKLECCAAAAVSVTLAPAMYEALHVPVVALPPRTHSMGADDTLPEPFPPSCTDNVLGAANDDDTCALPPCTITVQVAVAPVHAPPQLVNACAAVLPDAPCAAAWSCTLVPSTTEVSHVPDVAPPWMTQSRPAPVIRPCPSPAAPMLSVRIAANAALAVRAVPSVN